MAKNNNTKRGDEKMEIKCTVEELKELLNIKNAEIKIDGEKVGKLIAPSVGKEFSNKI